MKIRIEIEKDNGESLTFRKYEVVDGVIPDTIQEEIQEMVDSILNVEQF